MVVFLWPIALFFALGPNLIEDFVRSRLGVPPQPVD